MGYYIRVLGTENKKINYKTILKANNKISSISIEQGEKDDWTFILVKNKGIEILSVEKNVVAPNSLAANELHEFEEEIEDYYPKSSVEWLKNYFAKIKVIYALSIQKGAYEGNNWDIVTSIQEVIWNHVGGILQADLEGFTNEYGYQILWQFDENITGTWNMAVLNAHAEWETFEMDLGDGKHRELFKAGKIVNL